MSAEQFTKISVDAQEKLAWSMRSAVAVTLLVAWSTTAAAENACTQWKVGDFYLQQSNGTVATVDQVRQDGSQFTGQGTYGYYKRETYAGIPIWDSRVAYGVVDGTVSGNNFEAVIRWKNASVGVYKGQISPQGVLSGHTYDQTDPAAQADFYAKVPLECLSRQASSPGLGLSTKPSVALGRVQTTTPDSTPGAICERARDARARQSPAAASLEKQCREYKASLRESTSAVSRRPTRTGLNATGLNAAETTTAVSASPLARVGLSPATQGLSAAEICAAAKAARQQGSADAARLERQCKAMTTVGETTAATSKKSAVLDQSNVGQATGDVPAALMPGGTASTPWNSIGDKKSSKFRSRLRAQDSVMQTGTTPQGAMQRNQGSRMLNPQPLPPEDQRESTDAAAMQQAPR